MPNIVLECNLSASPNPIPDSILYLTLTGDAFRISINRFALYHLLDELLVIRSKAVSDLLVNTIK